MRSIIEGDSKYTMTQARGATRARKEVQDSKRKDCLRSKGHLEAEMQRFPVTALLQFPRVSGYLPAASPLPLKTSDMLTDHYLDSEAFGQQSMVTSQAQRWLGNKEQRA